MNYPPGYKYTPEHEWIRLEGDEAVVGITHFAQEELGDVVFVELPVAGELFDEGDEIGSIESVKAVAEIYAPLSGEVTAINEKIEESPDLVNSDPHGEGWLVRIKMSEPSQLSSLLSAEAYVASLGSSDN